MKKTINEGISTFNAEINGVITKLPNYATDEQFKAICKGNLEILANNGGETMLVDSTELGVMGNEKKVFIEKVWFPLAFQTKLKRMVFLEPKTIWGKIGLQTNEKVADKVDGNRVVVGPITILTCSDLEEAMAFLKGE